jgi:organic radical activating enzyme
MKETRLRVNEIFYSIQGEGANAGMAAVFVRLSGCNLQCPFCDTRHESYTEMSVGEIRAEAGKYNCPAIVWTGGEPLLQLTKDVLERFTDFDNFLETNGTRPIPYRWLAYVACSPKVDPDTLERNLIRPDEFRYPVKVGDALPDIDILPYADHYFVSPVDASRENVDYCLKLIKNNPQWKLSVQLHKLLNIQ